MIRKFFYTFLVVAAVRRESVVRPELRCRSYADKSARQTNDENRVGIQVTGSFNTTSTPPPPCLSGNHTAY